MLTAQFRELEVDSMIHRKVYQRVPPKVAYSASEYGERNTGSTEKANKKQKKVLGGIKVSRVVKVDAPDTYVSFC